MYVYQEQNPDRRIMNSEGRCFAGVPIGIILFGVANYTLPPGSVENATSFKYPVYYKAIPAADHTNVLRPEPHPEVLAQLIATAKEMQGQGCRAIIGACGYFGNYLPMVRKEVDVPCFFSSLMQLPMILNSIPENKKVGIICSNGSVMPETNVIKNCRVSDEDRSRLVIRGGGGDVDMPEMVNVLKDLGGYNPKQLEREVVKCAERMLKDEPDIAAFLLECTLLPACSYAVQEALRMPVYDFVTLIDWVHSAVVHRPFYGYI